MKLLLIFLISLTIHTSYAQDKEDHFFVLDKDWKPTVMKNAEYFLRVRQTKDKNYEWLFYNMFGPRIRKESFSDMAGKIYNGECMYYRPDGSLDSTGSFVNGVLNGTWYFWNEGRVVRKKEYDNGVLTKDTLYLPRKAEPAVKKEPHPGEVESAFKGGAAGWSRFLHKNLTYPQRAVNAKISGRAVLQFQVDETGKVIQPEINRSVEYSIDEAALDIIRKSPEWMPALKDGKPVMSYKLQPISFLLP